MILFFCFQVGHLTLEMFVIGLPITEPSPLNDILSKYGGQLPPKTSVQVII